MPKRTKRGGCFGNRCSRKKVEEPPPAPPATLRQAVNEFGTNQLKVMNERDERDLAKIPKRMETNAALAAVGMLPPGETLYSTHYNNYRLDPDGVVRPYPTNVAQYTQGPKGSVTSGQGRRTRRRKHSRRRR
jgi:hypothetical protein